MNGDGIDPLARWLQPQDDFDVLSARARRAHPRGLVDLAYANAWDGPLDAVREAMQGALQGERRLDLQYTPYGGGTVARRCVARSLDDSHARGGQRHHYADIVLTPGAMAALHVAFRALAPEPGDEVIVPVPCWLDYPLYLAHLGLVPRLVPMTGRDLDLDLAAIEAAIGERTRALVISQPANPMGRIWTEDELSALGDVLGRAGVALISDESHRSLCDPVPPAPAQIFADTVSVYSFGKHLMLQGQRIGFVAVHPQSARRDALRARFEVLVRAMGFCTPTALMQRALPALLEVKPTLEVFASRRQRARAALERAGYVIPKSDGTFFLYPQAPGGDAVAFAERAADAGVLVLPGEVFHHHGHFRVSLTDTDVRIDGGLEKLAALGPTPPTEEAA